MIRWVFSLHSATRTSFSASASSSPFRRSSASARQYSDPGSSFNPSDSHPPLFLPQQGSTHVEEPLLDDGGVGGDGGGGEAHVRVRLRRLELSR